MGNKPKGFALIMGATGRGGFPSTSSRATSTFLSSTKHSTVIASQGLTALVLCPWKPVLNGGLRQAFGLGACWQHGLPALRCTCQSNNSMMSPSRSLFVLSCLCGAPQNGASREGLTLYPGWP
jgi:hypothetical protein